ncbi:MAG: PAS/PAC sensor signal transduction histidine kinase [Puniceicoccaceae bacterium 5H]|nr:MAG: PAS/PAC sensor signal transduction histidine kinase [Puniceicoccaceae bacterium 5H]
MTSGRRQFDEVFASQLLDAVPYSLLVLDSDDTVVFANDRFRKLFVAVNGRELVPDEPYRPQIHCESCLGLLEMLDRDATARPCFDVEFEGETHTFQLHRYPLGENERYTVLQLDDVTASKQAERRAAAAQEGLREAMRTRDVILSIIGHDLRAPIAQLNAILYLLKQTPGQMSEDKLQQYSGELEDMTRHLSSALDNLLHWSTSHRRGLDPELSLTDVGQVLSESVGLLHPLALHKQIFLALENDVTEDIRTDREMLAFIMRNLLANAVKFTPKQGRIDIRQGQADGHFYFEVRDSGVGMSQDQIQQIQRHDTFHSTRGTNGERGIGLGLKLCQEFAEKLGGRITFDSEIDAGTQVRLNLPLQQD